jgi:hypothetical protein
MRTSHAATHAGWPAADLPHACCPQPTATNMSYHDCGLAYGQYAYADYSALGFTTTELQQPGNYETGEAFAQKPFGWTAYLCNAQSYDYICEYPFSAFRWAAHRHRRAALASCECHACHCETSPTSAMAPSRTCRSCPPPPSPPDMPSPPDQPPAVPPEPDYGVFSSGSVQAASAAVPDAPPPLAPPAPPVPSPPRVLKKRSPPPAAPPPPAPRIASRVPPRPPPPSPQPPKSPPPSPQPPSPMPPSKCCAWPPPACALLLHQQHPTHGTVFGACTVSPELKRDVGHQASSRVGAGRTPARLPTAAFARAASAPADPAAP